MSAASRETEIRVRIADWSDNDVRQLVIWLYAIGVIDAHILKQFTSWHRLGS